MVRRFLAESASKLILGVGAALFLTSAMHHVSEINRISEVTGPMLALALDGTLALAVVYGGWRLADSDFASEHRWRVAVWCLLGIAVLVGTTAAGIAIRRFEGRVVSESVFQLLLAADAGAVSGLIAGFYDAQTHAHARQAERATTTLRFVNDLLRHAARNHVSAILAHADIARRETDDEDVSNAASSVREQAHEITDLVENAGAIAETVSGDGNVGRIDLAAVAAEEAQRVAETFDATVRTDLPERAPVAANEAVRFVVKNLAENAAEHNDADDPRVELAVTDGDESVRLRVADNGPGIPGSRKPELFDPNARSRHGGGLHLVATLVDNYGGDVRVEDGDAGGAAFVVRLPRGDAQ
ncbi:ATP-binding protein [Halorussus gelatinilyticus]|uniref:histidine kinase n=1 Tax=Halorussus gelatinilyticus TaxID=2937524 RepID=A0A8U0IGA5_9EURY|nr:ATP-binding protein [Halorussus gelatinilyticus]UPV99705.1 ATP-binding protein [Halorussus gelatinilyticus]